MQLRRGGESEYKVRFYAKPYINAPLEAWPTKRVGSDITDACIHSFPFLDMSRVWKTV